jgi:hypothetical protein
LKSEQELVKQREGDEIVAAMSTQIQRQEELMFCSGSGETFSMARAHVRWCIQRVSRGCRLATSLGS